MIDLDHVVRDVEIAAAITRGRATVTVEGVTTGFGAADDDELRAGILRRIVAVATELGGPVQLTLIDHGEAAVVVVAPDGATARIAALLPAGGATRTTPRHLARRSRSLARRAIVPVSAGMLTTALVVAFAIAISAGGRDADPASAAGPAAPAAPAASSDTAPRHAPVRAVPAPVREDRRPVAAPALAAGLTQAVAPSTAPPAPPSTVPAVPTPPESAPPQDEGNGAGGRDQDEPAPSDPATVDPSAVPEPVDPDDVPSPVDPDDTATAG